MAMPLVSVMMLKQFRLRYGSETAEFGCYTLVCFCFFVNKTTAYVMVGLVYLLVILLQVLEDQKLLRDRILHLTGSAGLSRMEEALKGARTKYAETLENGLSATSPFQSPLSAGSSFVSPSSGGSSVSESSQQESTGTPKPRVVRSLFKFPSPVGEAPKNLINQDMQDIQSSVSGHKDTGITNEHIVNEMLHDSNWQLTNGGSASNEPENSTLIDPVTSKIADMQVLSYICILLLNWLIRELRWLFL